MLTKICSYVKQNYARKKERVYIYKAKTGKSYSEIDQNNKEEK